MFSYSKFHTYGMQGICANTDQNLNQDKISFLVENSITITFQFVSNNLLTRYVVILLYSKMVYNFCNWNNLVKYSLENKNAIS